MGFVVHLVAYVAVNTVFVLIWATAGGTDHSIGDAFGDPIGALRHDGFWPMWVISGWGAALAIHGAASLALARRRRRKRRRERAIRRHETRTAVRASRSAPGAEAAPGVDAIPGVRTRGAPGRRWVVALFTDVVDSTGLAEALGDDEWNDVVLTHRRVVRHCIAEHRGVEVGTQGDGFLVQFDDPADGVACAMALQLKFEEDRQAGTFAPPVRMGIHAGEVVGAEDGDLVGRMVNIAARVTAVARAGEIVVTEPVADQLSPRIVLQDHGLHALRGIERPRHLLTVEWRPELPLTDDLDAPSDPDRLGA